MAGAVERADTESGKAKGTVMQIGIHGGLIAEDIPLYRDLGVTWTKFGVDLSSETVPDLTAQFDLADSLGIRCVVDLRTTPLYLSECSVKAQQAMAEAGELTSAGPDATDEEQRAAILANNQRVHPRAYAKLYEVAAATVYRYRDRCNDWEFWGECRCPWVSGSVFGDRSQTYPAILEGFYAAVKAAVPECRVWIGGNGMDLQLAFFHACLDQGAGKSFDVCNLHPYFMQIRDRANADRVLKQEYPRLREALAEKGTNQPFAATEWGYPTHNIDSLPVESYLRSNVVREGVRQLYWSEAEEWFEKDLQVMEDSGFETVIVHALRDTEDGSMFWGNFCGLIDLQGRKKNVWDVVQRWAWKGREAS